MIMNRKRKIVIVLLSCILIFVFSYTITIGILTKRGEVSIKNSDSKAQFTSVNNAVVTKKSKIKFILRYNNSLDTVYSNDKLIQPIHVDEDKLQGLSMGEIEEIFSSFGYKIDKFEADEIVLSKDMDCYDYENGTYFIGINDGKIAVLKKNSDGVLSVAEAQISNPKAGDGINSYLTIKDIENKGSLLKSLYEGRKDYQFSDIQEAIEYAQALCST